jgi:uncharacterized protein YecE (DUF72 family)
VDLRVGTSGWRHLADFYPPRTREADMLSVYAEEFSLVEIDSTFQGVPGVDRIAEWADSVNDDFRFHVLAFGGLCLHQLRPGTKPQPGVSWRDYAVPAPDFLFGEFAAALEPLGAKLGAVTMQFPAYFGASAESENYLAECRANLPGLPLAAEFRDPSWLTGNERLERTQELLIDQEIALVATDFESAAEAPPPICAATRGDVTVARLHGRGTGDFAHQAEDPLARARHQYGQGQLEEIWAALRPLGEEVDRLDVILRTDPTVCVAAARRLGEIAATPDPEPDWSWRPAATNAD